MRVALRGQVVLRLLERRLKGLGFRKRRRDRRGRIDEVEDCNGFSIFFFFFFCFILFYFFPGFRWWQYSSRLSKEKQSFVGTCVQVLQRLDFN